MATSWAGHAVFWGGLGRASSWCIAHGLRWGKNWRWQDKEEVRGAANVWRGWRCASATVLICRRKAKRRQRIHPGLSNWVNGVPWKVSEKRCKSKWPPESPIEAATYIIQTPGFQSVSWGCTGGASDRGCGVGRNWGKAQQKEDQTALPPLQQEHRGRVLKDCEPNFLGPKSALASRARDFIFM